MSIEFIYDNVLEKKKKALQEIVEELEPKKKAPPHTMFLRRWLFACFKAAEILKLEEKQLPNPPRPIIKRIPVVSMNPFSLNQSDITQLDRSNLDLY